MRTHTPFVLMILDGWGHRRSKANNAIAMANTPIWDDLVKQYPHVLLSASGNDVGLPKGQMGNSEVGHLNLGAGQIVPQNYTRITGAIEDKSFYHNQTLIDLLQNTQQKGGRLHVLGLLSDGGIHAHECHIHALLQLAEQQHISNICVHAFLDGRDTAPKSALTPLNALDNALQKSGVGKIATVIGRYYAMDRDNRWDRIEKAYRLMTGEKADHLAETAEKALKNAYQRGESDEFVQSTCIGQPVLIGENDSFIFMNFRADRARQLTHAFIEKDFGNFTRKHCVEKNRFITLTEYDSSFQLNVVFPPLRITHCLGAYLSIKNYRQLRLAETEKYAHVTFFFNGGIETPFEGEKRQLIPSPHVATYDLQPEMSAPELTNTLVEAIESGKYDVIICNYANADMVGHTGDIKAAIKAVETIDRCLDRVVNSLKTIKGELLITADHGNIEMMENQSTGQTHTAHTCSPVPLLYVGRRAKPLQKTGILADVAPTLLALLDLEKPDLMTGKALFEIDK